MSVPSGSDIKCILIFISQDNLLLRQFEIYEMNRPLTADKDMKVNMILVVE